MMRIGVFGLLACVLGVTGCADSSSQINPFLVYTETFGLGGTGGDGDSGTGGGFGSQAAFRQPILLTFRNNHPSADLTVSFLAWVDISRVRTAEQQDALIAGGYVQLARTYNIGTALTLPVGAFIYSGVGTVAATRVLLGPAQAAGGEGTQEQVTPTEEQFTFITPDGILAYLQPPVSCDSIAFVFSQNGEPLTSEPLAGGLGPFAGSNTSGGVKTLAQVNVYDCDPFQPGLYFQVSGVVTSPNQYLEGDNIVFEFNATPDADGNFAIVTIGGET